MQLGLRILGFILQLFIILGFAFSANAESIVATLNLPVTHLFNHFYYGRGDCEAITQKQTRQLSKKFTCTANDADPLKEQAGFNILKHTVFDASAALYQDKHACLVDYAEAVIKDPKLMTEFTQKLVPLYLNRKKAELILQQCAQISLAEASKTGLSAKTRKVRLSMITEMNFDFYDHCKNRQTVAALQSLIELSNMALPFMSSKAPYEIVDKKYRALLISSKTQKPLTDDEILHLTLDSAQEQMFFRGSETGPLKQDLIQHFRQKVEDHGHLADLLREGYSEEAMRELFKEGSAAQAMETIGMTEHAGKEDPSIRNMRYCMKNAYEENAFFGVFESFVIFVIAKKIPVAEIAPWLGMLNKSWIGDMAASVPASASAIYASCSENTQKRVPIGGAKKEVLPDADVNALPPGFDFHTTDFSKRRMQSLTSCRKLDLQKLFLRTEERLSCLAEALAGVMPPVISLPAMLFGQE